MIYTQGPRFLVLSATFANQACNLQTTWGSRAGADTNSDRMRIITEFDRAEEQRVALLSYTQ
jgi:hypothetical protein